MRAIVIYKTKYGSTKTYASQIASALGCEAINAKGLKAESLKDYDTIIYGGGLYAEVIAGVNVLCKNIELLKNKKIIVYTTGITPIDCREYYDKMVWEKNFRPEVQPYIKMYNYPGKMVLEELSPVHRMALKSLKKIMSAKKNPTEMEKMLIDLCDADGDFTDIGLIDDLIEYARG